MDMGPYLYKMKMQILVQLSYRFEVFATLAARYVQIVATVFLWDCVYPETDGRLVNLVRRDFHDLYLQCAGNDTKGGAGGKRSHGADQTLQPAGTVSFPGHRKRDRQFLSSGDSGGGAGRS